MRWTVRHLGFRVDQRRRQKGNHQLVVAGQFDTLAGAARGTFDDIVVGPIVLQEVQIHGGEPAQRRSQISDQTDRLEKNFRQDYR